MDVRKLDRKTNGEGVTAAGADKLHRHQQWQTGRAEKSERGHDDTLIWTHDLGQLGNLLEGNSLR